jgi:hypothetical protein
MVDIVSCIPIRSYARSKMAIGSGSALLMRVKAMSDSDEIDIRQGH